MLTVRAETADGIWEQAWMATNADGVRRTHSSGDSVELLHAVLELEDPRQRWVTIRTPAMNAAFAIAEVVWIMRGRNDSGFLTAWNKSLPKFAGSGSTFDGAYGERLRSRFGIDQLLRAAAALRERPEQRQIVLQIWDPRSDLPLETGAAQSPDVPCNVVSMLKIVDGRLDWLQVMRSNDLVRGLPYNLVQWTTIHEVLSGWVGAALGTYVHISDSLHVYENDRGRFDMDRVSTSARSSGDLRLPIEQSEQVFRALEVAISGMAASTDAGQIDELASVVSMPVYRDWLRVMSAERLHQIGRFDLSTSVAGSVEDPVLQTVLQRWLSRGKLS